MSKISIIVPVYNTELYLKECVDSILGQSFEDFELIAVDDGSTDSSPEILKEYKAHDSRVIVLEGGHKGAPHARNVGFDHASGEFCLFFDSDDYMLPGALEKLISASDDVNMVIGKFIVKRGNEFTNLKTIGKVGCLKTSNDEDLYDLMMAMWANPINKMIRRDWLLEQKITWFDCAVAQDLNYYQKILSVIDRVSVIPDDVSVHRFSLPGGITSQRNYKVLSVIDSLNDVESFAFQNNASQCYINALKSVRLLAYLVQIEKCKGMPLRDASKIGRSFYRESKQINCDPIDKKSFKLKSDIKWVYWRYCTVIKCVYVPYSKLRYSR